MNHSLVPEVPHRRDSAAQRSPPAAATTTTTTRSAARRRRPARPRVVHRPGDARLVRRTRPSPLRARSPPARLTIAGTPVPAHCQVTGTHVRPHQHGRRQDLYDRLPDAPAERLERALLLPGQRRHRRQRRHRERRASAAVPLTNALRRASPSSARTPATTLRRTRPSASIRRPGSTTATRPSRKLTPMAKAVIQTAYGKGPDRSYIGGCSNGGRHTLVAASRFADQYDGFLAGDPGLRLPLAALANIAGYQTYLTASRRTRPTLSTGFTVAERQLVVERRPRQVRRARRCDRRAGPGHEGLPGRIRSEPRRADLRRRARRHLPQRSAEDRHRQAVLGRDDEHRHQDLHRASRTTTAWRSGNRPFWKFTAPPDARFGRGRLHLAGAAGRPGDLQRTDLRGDQQHRRRSTRRSRRPTRPTPRTRCRS